MCLYHLRDCEHPAWRQPEDHSDHGQVGGALPARTPFLSAAWGARKKRLGPKHLHLVLRVVTNPGGTKGRANDGTAAASQRPSDGPAWKARPDKPHQHVYDVGLAQLLCSST